MNTSNKNTGIIATVATALLCGCPGLCLCLFGAISAIGGGTYELGDQSGQVPVVASLAMICFAVILIVIPIVTGVVMLRKKPEAVAPISNEPLPPAS